MSYIKENWAAKDGVRSIVPRGIESSADFHIHIHTHMDIYM